MKGEVIFLFGCYQMASLSVDAQRLYSSMLSHQWLLHVLIRGNTNCIEMYI